MSETEQVGLGEAFDRMAAEAPDEPAIIFHDTIITRSQLARWSNRLARRLAGAGVGFGAHVTMALPNSPGFYAAAIAIWKLGAVPQPVSYRLPAPELDALIEVADPAAVIGQAGLDSRGRPLVDPDEPLDAFDDGPLPPVVPPTWKAMTSGGSTGRPKLIVTAVPGVADYVRLSGAGLRIDDGEVFLCTGPLYHNGPFLYSVSALYKGGRIVLMERFDASKSLELVETHGVTYMYLVPTMMSRILRLPDEERLGRDMSSVRIAYHLAAPCPPHVKQAWIDWLGPEVIVELYAGTEAQAATTITGTEWLAHPGSVGRVTMGEMKVCDVDGNEQPPGEVGEIWMRTLDGGRTYRYIGAEARSRDGWESLGDMGWFDEDHYLFLADRQTDMILVGGANVYPAEVEAALDAHPAVLSSCIIGLPDEDYGSVVHAIVELSRPVTDDELREHLSARLVSYKLPRTFERSQEPLRDDAGKVRRSALRAARLPAV
ncbi:MAG TPA: AMP-binding protein [Acidimicrobiales bacterium]|jgi:bile acid-coenzyme A ligase|nr:AMP-binding protein [Acidimicrobiales bacterium]